MRAVDGLRLDGRIPPGIEQEHVFGFGEVEAKPARLEADEEYLTAAIRLEPLHSSGPIPRLTVEVLELDSLVFQPGTQQGEQARELREHERLVSFLDDLDEMRQQDIELGR